MTVGAKETTSTLSATGYITKNCRGLLFMYMYVCCEKGGYGCGDCGCVGGCDCVRWWSIYQDHVDRLLGLAYTHTHMHPVDPTYLPQQRDGDGEERQEQQGQASEDAGQDEEREGEDDGVHGGGVLLHALGDVLCLVWVCCW